MTHHSECPAQRLRLFALLLCLIFLSPAWLNAETLECSELPQLFALFLKRHYGVKNMTDTVKAHTVDQFIKNMDPSKSLLLQSDVDKLKPELIKTFHTMLSGDCGEIQAAAQVFITRAKENEAFVKHFVSDNYKLDEKDEFLFDPDKRSFPKDQAEREQLLKNLVHFQVATYLQSNTKLSEAKQHLIHRYELTVKRFSEEKQEDLLTTFAESFALALDPHSTYMSRDELADFQIQMNLSLEGIGAQLTSQDGMTVIDDLIPGGSADRSKLLKPKDKIVAVTQEGGKPVSVIDMDLREVVKLIRGKKGTKVILSVLRQSAGGTKSFQATIPRDKIDIKDQAAKIYFQTKKIGPKTYKFGILNLPSFYGDGKYQGVSCYRDVKNLLIKANKERVDGLVLDLSRNGGGLLEEAVQIAGLFLKKGSVVATRSTGDKVEVLDDDDASTLYSGPLVVLTSRLSASASEIVTGALHDYHRAVVVGGDHTFGKGSVQAVADLPFNLGAMKVTTGMFFIPSGKSTQVIGVPSDVVLPSPYTNSRIGEVTLDYALPAQSIPAFYSKDIDSDKAGEHWAAINETLVKKLSERSQDRVAKSTKFAEIQKNIAESKKNEGMIRIAEVLKKSDDKKTAKNKKKKSEEEDSLFSHNYDLSSPYVQEGESVLADMLALSSEQAIVLGGK